jgi:hypothetical protein
MMTPVHAEETGIIEFDFTREIIEKDTTSSSSFDSEILTNLTMSGLEPNKEYQVDVGSTSGQYTTDNNGTLTVSLYGINPGKPQHVTIKGVSQLSYSINHAQFIHPSTRHQSNIDIYHNGTLVETTVAKRNQGVKTGIYTVNAGSKEKIVIRDNMYRAFTTGIMGYVDGVGDPNQSFQYTVHITGLDPEDTVFFHYMDAQGDDNPEVHATNNEIVYNVELGGSSHAGVYVYSVPWYAKVTVTQHANNLGYLPNWQTDSEMGSNTIPGIALSTPEFGHDGDTSGDLTVVFVNTKVQTVTVSKAVEGNQGNRHKQFGFNAKLTDNNDIEYTGPVSIAKQDGAVEQLTHDENNVYKFTLKHGDTVKLFGFDKVVKNVTITEEDNDYQTKVSHDSEQPVDGKSVTVDIENTNASIRYTNSKSLIVPTGISLPVGGALFIIVGIGIIFISKKHKQVV